MIRRARLADVVFLPVLERSAAQAFQDIAGLEWVVSHEVMPEAEHEEAVRTGLSWSALRDGEPIGFAVAAEHEDGLHLLELSVAHEAQGHGAGTRLVEAVIAAARERGKVSVTLTTFLDLRFNERFYRKLGFVRLTAAGMPERLRDCLAHEVALGLPGERRCAMRLVL
nr:GNAT family N-acetyltransferase [Acetobacter fallax]